MTEPLTNISYKGKEYPIDTFSEELQNLCKLGYLWEQDLAHAQSNLKMIEVALEAIHKKAAEAIAAELNAREQVVDLSPRFTETV